MNICRQGVASRKVLSKRRKSFTLVELLVVVAVILVLVGLSLKTMSLVTRKGGVARTTWILEQVKNALGSYYAMNGIYPPVASVPYVYMKTPVASLPNIPSDPDWTTGLVYFIFSDPPYPQHNPDAQRWKHYLEGIGSDSGYPTNKTVGFAVVYYTNGTHGIDDAWGQGLHYECLPPYSTYRLWSEGPNKKDNKGGGDDLGVAPGE